MGSLTLSAMPPPTDSHESCVAAGADPAGVLHIAMLAPPWISVPPDGYGGMESVVSLLSDELVRRGHAVVLLCAPGSRSTAAVRPLLAEPHPDRIGEALFEADHVGRAFAAIEAEQAAGRRFARSGHHDASAPPSGVGSPGWRAPAGWDDRPPPRAKCESQPWRPDDRRDRSA